MDIFKEFDNVIEKEKSIETMYNILYGYEEIKYKIIVLAKGVNINRVLDHVRGNAEDKYINSPFIMISAFKSENTKSVNRMNNARLTNDIQNAGLGFIRLIGHYVYKSGESSTEESFLIPGVSKYNGTPKKIWSFDEIKSLAIKLCHDYNQESVLYGNDKEIYLYYRESDNHDYIGNRLSMTVEDLIKIKDTPFSVLKTRETIKNPKRKLIVENVDSDKEDLKFKTPDGSFKKLVSVEKDLKNLVSCEIVRNIPENSIHGLSLNVKGLL